MIARPAHVLFPRPNLSVLDEPRLTPDEQCMIDVIANYRAVQLFEPRAIILAEGLVERGHLIRGQGGYEVPKVL